MGVKRYTFSGKLVLVSALHVGSGGGGAVGSNGHDTDAAVARDTDGVAFIPGSSLRGALRNAIAQLAPQLGLPILRDDVELNASVPAAIKARREELNAQSIAFDESQCQELLNSPDVLTSAERLFGTVWWASPLCIPDLYPQDEQEVASGVRHRVGIDQDTGAARDGAKYDFEVLQRGPAFPLRLILEVSDEDKVHEQYWRQLIAVGLRLLELGDIRLGGRGLGSVRLQDLRVSLLDTNDRSQLLAMLRSQEPAARDGAPLPEDWVTSQLAEVA